MLMWNKGKIRMVCTPPYSPPPKQAHGTGIWCHPVSWQNLWIIHVSLPAPFLKPLNSFVSSQSEALSIFMDHLFTLVTKIWILTISEK